MKRVSLTILGFAALLPAASGQVTGGGYATSIVAGGGPLDGVGATSIALSTVNGIAVDSAGNVFVPSSTQNRVYKVATNGTISTVAGNGILGYSGDGGPATSARLNSPNGVTVDSAGNLYIADTGNARIRKVSGGVITTVAGTGIFGYSSDGGPATVAWLNSPNGVAVDGAGNLYIADTSNARIRKVTGGVITTVAGTGTLGYSGDGGAAVAAQISYAQGVAVDSTGNNLYIADSGIYRVRRVSGGVITTVAGTGTSGYSGDGGAAVSAQISNVQGVALDSAGNLYIADSDGCRIRKVSGGVITRVAGTGNFGYFGDGGLAANAAFRSPNGVAVDSAGSLYIADTSNFRIRKVSGGVINTIAGNGSFEYSGDNGPATSAQLSPAGIAVSSGFLYIADFQDYRLRRVAGGIISTVAGVGAPGYSGDSGPAISAQIDNITGVAVDGAGNQYIADSRNNRVRKVSGGVITTVAGTGAIGYSGDGGPATSAQLISLGAIAADSSGTVYITDQTNNRVRKISGGVITLVAGGVPADGSAATAISIYVGKTAVDSAGNVYVLDQSHNRVYRVATNGTISAVAGNGTRGYSGDGGPAASAQLYSPAGVAVDGAGSLYIADTFNCRIRRVSGGVINTIAGTDCGYSGDGGLATSARLSLPSSLAIDSAGNLYIADITNYRIRRVSGGVITTVAGTGTSGYSGDGGPATSAQISFCTGVALDSTGNLYIADTNNNRVRRVSGGVITTVAGIGAAGYSGDGGPATSAQISGVGGVAADSAGNLYISDFNNFRIRKVSGGVITTVAGNGTNGYSGDGGLATSAQIGGVQGVEVDSAGSLYLADVGNARIRKVSGGFITTIAGNGSFSYSGDGGPAANAQLSPPSGLAVDNSGNLYISDYANQRVRVVSPGGTITTMAGGGTQDGWDGGPATSAYLFPRGLAVDGAHNVYIVDRDIFLRKVSAGGVITTVAGNVIFPFNNYGGVAVDSSGNVYLSEAPSGRVQLIVPVGVLTADSVSPPSGNTANANLTAVYSDTAGYPNLGYVHLLINTGLSVSNACYVAYQPSSNTVILLNDAGTSWLGPITAGSGTTLQNSQCVLNGIGSSATGSGNSLNFTASISFKSSFAGGKTVFLYADGGGGSISGWQSRGTWTVPGNAVVTADSVTPSSGSTTNATLTAVYSDTAGYTSLGYVHLLINSGVVASNACYVAYQRSGNTLILLNDAGTNWLGPIAAGSAGTLQNSQCVLNGSGSSATGSASSLNFTASLSFKPLFAGGRNVFLYADGGGGIISGWQSRGTWTVPGNAVVTADSVSPSSGNTTNATLTAVYSDTAGYTSLGYVHLLINSGVVASNACYVAYQRSGNTLILLNDAGSGWLGPITTGSAGTLQNSQCVLNGTGSSATGSGNSLNFTASLSFKPSFAGSKTVFLYADGGGGIISGWQSRGTWTVPGSEALTADSVAPSSGTTVNGTLTAVYSDTAGYTNLGYAHLLINAGLSASNACYVAYQRSSNSLILLNDAGNGWLGPIAAGSGVTLQNSQCVLNASGSSATGSGSNLTLTVSLTFKPSFTGSKTVFLYADGSGGLNSGWQSRGTWTVP